MTNTGNDSHVGRPRVTLITRGLACFMAVVLIAACGAASKPPSEQPSHASSAPEKRSDHPPASSRSVAQPVASEPFAPRDVSVYMDADKDPTMYSVPIGTSPSLGDDRALVTIVQFFGFSAFDEESQTELLKVVREFGGKVRLVWKYFPYSNLSPRWSAAALALEAYAQKGPEGLWKALERLRKARGFPEDVNEIVDAAVDLKLDIEKVRHAFGTNKARPQLEEDRLLGMKLLAEAGHLFINGRRVVWGEFHQPRARLVSVINKELETVADRFAKGPMPINVYSLLVSRGQPVPKLVIDVPRTAPTRGSSGAKVVIQEFANFIYPQSAEVEPIVAQVLKEYGDQVRLVWRDYVSLSPLLRADRRGILAAHAGREALNQKGVDGFWKMHDLLLDARKKAMPPESAGPFANPLNRLQKFALDPVPTLERPALDGYARRLGLDMTAWATHLDGLTYTGAIEADALAMIDAAPLDELETSFVINDYYIRGEALTYETLASVVRYALDEAR